MFPEGKLSEVRYRPTVYLTNGPARYVVSGTFWTVVETQVIKSAKCWNV